MGTPRHTRDITLWLSPTIFNLNFFMGSCEVRDNKRQLYPDIFVAKMREAFVMQKPLTFFSIKNIGVFEINV